MPATFENLGIAFQYPENWTLDEEDVRAGRLSVTVYSPEGGFWSVSLHPEAADPAVLAEAAVEALREEYGNVESHPVAETVAGHRLTGFDVNFFFLDLTNTAVIRTFRADPTTYTIFYQAEDREFTAHQRVYEAMTASLLRGIPTDETL